MSSTLRTREVTIDRAHANTAARTVPASLSSEAPIRRGGVVEVLRHDAQSIDLSRAADGLPLLFGHDRQVPVGIVEGVRIEGRRLLGTLRFGNSSRASEIWEDVAAGILKSLSISYSVDAEEAGDNGQVIATRWMPYEASVVSVAADFTVGIGRAAEPHPQQGTAMSETQTDTTAERERATDITTLCTRHTIPAETMARYISEGTTVEAVRAAILDSLVRQDEQTGATRRNVTPTSWLIRPEQGDQSRALMEEAVVSRLGGPRASTGNPYQHQRVLDMARERAEVFGIRTTALSPSQILERAFGTSDFPNLLGNALNKVLGIRYASYPAGLKRAARPSTIKDFRAKSVLRLGETPALVKVNELGEYKQGSMADVKESYAIATYGRIVSISRQALINDDLQAFETLAQRFAQAASEFEAKFLVDLLTSNPTMNEDGLALFHASHGNLATGGGSALSLTSLSTARKALRLTKGIDATTAIDATPKYLIVPATLETTAEQLLTQTTPAVVSEVNPFGAVGKLELIVEPRLDAVSATAWYLSADPMQLDTLEYAYLEGEPGPQIFTETGFEIDGMSMKCRLDFGCGVLDWRGLYKANGA